jgi:hypothetical protein
MTELINAAFSPVNLPLTVTLILMLVYWITVILGVLDVELFDVDLDSGVDLDAAADFDMDVDADVDVDVDAEVDVDVGIEGAGLLRSMLVFFYVGEVPVMILFSILILSLWTISMLANHHLNPSGSFVLGLPLFAGNAVVSLLICKVIGMPLKNFYSKLNRDENAPRDVMGRICVVITTSVSKKMGQAEVKTRGAPILLNVVSEGDHVFNKGDEAVITGKDEQSGVYTIAPVDLES